MSAPFSIIIPTLNAGAELPETLNSLLPGLAQGLIAELIISDGGSEDDTLQIAKDAGAVVVSGGNGRGEQLKRGADIAKADWLIFLHADTHLPEVWPGALGVHIAGTSEAAAFKLTFRSKSLMAKFTAWWANMRSHIFGLPYGDQGLVISRRLYDEVGGFSSQPLMEDVDMSLKLRNNLKLLDEYVSTSASRYEDQGWIIRGTGNLWTLLRYWLGVPPEKLAKRYHKL